MIKIYGRNSLYEALNAKSNIDTIYMLDSNKKEGLYNRIIDSKYAYKICDKQFMDKTFGTHNQGYGAFRSDYNTYSVETFISDSKGKRLLLLDGISDPQNFGAILRSADAFGIDGIILPKNKSVPITEVVAHVSTGAIEWVKICYTNNLATCIEYLKKNGYWIVGTDAEATLTAKEVDKDLNLAIIIGSEGFGMHKLTEKRADYLVKIPMSGHVNSLNASVSAGIILNLFSKE